jgi:electron transfer flavoprotein beta subunit
MHIVVCVKMVPDTTRIKIDPVTNTLVREGIPFITNPFDTNALEEALRIKDRYGATVNVISMGPPSAEVVIRQAIALGADKGLLLSDRAFGGADTLATSLVLAQAIAEMSKQEKVDLIFCGKQTIDGDTAQVGPGIATRLGFSQLTLVDRVASIDETTGTIVCRRRFEDRHETVQTALPALVSVVREINRPRYPSVPGRLHAEEVDIPLWNNYVLKLDPGAIGLRGSPTQVKRIFAPIMEKGEVVSVDNIGAEKTVDIFVRKLTDWKIVGTD